MLLHAASPLGGAGLRPAVDPAGAGAPDDGAVAPHEFPQECRGNVDVSVDDETVHTFEGYAADCFTEVLHDEASLLDGRP